ncbi:hypothetical protein [Bradyrhizobium sp. SZCCHNRI3042]|uniref:hypothetical protein n=1 Tax=Bradyrhizobium sp. SZCCHNRI3042 TaxID=3057291 RepID=UPI002915CAA8|nr:hypothetical protein [Bradyrhizobium sp. SZCCHNRI3042]
MENEDREFEQLKLLFDYTKFHIGLYTTVATIFGGLYSASDKLPFKFNSGFLIGSVICILLAGIAGGTIASCIPAYNGYTKFWGAVIGPFRLKLFTAETWTYIEHSTFWFAVLLAFLAIIAHSPSPATSAPHQSAALSTAHFAIYEI